MYRVNEIFYSLQGEGFYTGTPAVFLRFSGCNLKCGFCDTAHETFTEMDVRTIVDRLCEYPSHHVVVTGGEPSLQLDDMLVDVLHEAGFYVQVETNGTRPLPGSVDWVTCSPKAGGKVVLDRIDEVKLVYTGQPETEIDAIASSLPAMHYFLQPCSGENIPETVDYILSHPYWRLSLQTHKLIDIP